MWIVCKVQDAIPAYKSVTVYFSTLCAVEFRFTNMRDLAHEFERLEDAVAIALIYEANVKEVH
jgi:hypothetical protein